MAKPFGAFLQIPVLSADPVGSPPANTTWLYFKSTDGFLYQKTSAGVASKVDTTGGTSSHTLESHSNVLSTAPAAGDGLIYESGQWSHRPLVKGDVGLTNVDNTSDASKPISTATQTALNGKEASISSGATSHFWAGNKTFRAIGTADLPTGIPQANIASLSSDLSARELLSNKSTSTALGTSTTLYPSQSAVKTYVDNVDSSIRDKYDNFKAAIPRIERLSNTAQSFPHGLTTFTLVTFNTYSDWDTGDFNSTTQTITILLSGVFIINVSIVFENATAGRRAVLVTKNTTTAPTSFTAALGGDARAAASNGQTVVQASFTERLATNDVIRVYGSQNSGASLATSPVDGPGTRISITRIGA